MINDDQLERLAKRLGDRAAAEVDPLQTAWAVLSRLRRERKRRRPWLVRFGLVPAVAAAVLVGALAIRGAVTSNGNGIAFPVPVEVEDLADAELIEVLDSLEWEVPVSELMPVALADLTESELMELLEYMEG